MCSTMFYSNLGQVLL
uniref:Uncharacterized protein n=1 Tax=Anguilla anguilla TaxID=7936 RepID=A0A0E9QZL0_ANGAN